MAWLSSTFDPASVGGSGKVYQFRPDSDETTQQNELPLPAGINITDTPPSAATYRSRQYFTSMATENMMVDEFYRLGKCGRPAPVEVPTLATGGAGGRTGSCIVAIAFYDEFDDEWGPLSGISSAVTLANQKATTGNIPTTCSDPRMTHVGVWVSMDGGLFRLATKRLIGVSSITEGVATLALGAAFFTTFESLPRGTVNAIYHERQFVAGDALHPDVVYASALLFPERYEGLAFRTRNGEPVVAMIPTKTILLVLTRSSAYGLRGYTEDDMAMEQIDGDIGALNQQSVRLVNGNPVWPNDKSIWLYNGGFHDILRDRKTEWSEMYKAFPTIFENGFAVVDPNEYTYSFWLTDPSNNIGTNRIPNPDSASLQSLAWVGYYKDAVPELSGSFGQFEWFFDAWARPTYSAGVLALPGVKRGDVYFGFADGKTRKRDATNTDDNGDGYSKRAWIRTGALDMGDPGGSDQEGKTFTEHWHYVESETVAWNAYFKGGDEEAWQNQTPDNAVVYWAQSIAASRIANQDIGDPLNDGSDLVATYVPKTRHYCQPQRVVGHMLTMEYTIANAKDFKWRGFGGIYGPGLGARLPATVGEVG